MFHPIIDLIAQAYINNGWTGLDIPNTITYEPIQLGSGNPSPTNVRPILPAAILNIGGVDIPVYGGTMDVATKVLSVNMDNLDLGTLTYGKSSIVINGFVAIAGMPDNFPLAPSVTAIPNWLCSNYIVTSNIDLDSSLTDKAIAWRYSGSNKGVIVKDSSYSNIYDSFDANAFKLAMNGVQLVYEFSTPTTYQLTDEELYNAIGIKDYIAHRLKLPLSHYFPHPVIDALQSAAAGTQTADDTEILQHYLTPLGIGGI